MKTITATVNYPVYVQLDVEDSMTEDDVREKILDTADQIFQSSSIDPIIHECSEPELID